MFCSACGQPNSDDFSFCSKCGKQITPLSTAQPPSPSTIPTSPNPEGSAQKSSGIVTAMSVIGLVFGLIGMLGSFIPIIGIFTIKICIGAAIISGLAIMISFSQNASRTFPIVALTLSLIGVAIWFVQINKIESAVKTTKNFVDEMRTKTKPSLAPKPTKAASAKSGQKIPVSETENPLTIKYCGTWEYEDKYASGQKMYLKITKDKPGQFRFERGYKYKGDMIWNEIYIENGSGIYLRPSKDKLKGEFVSGNFYATHGQPFTYKITFDIKSDNKMLYSVFSSIRGETDKYEVTKVSD